MELFTHAKAVRLKSRHDKFLYADEDELHVTQDRNGSSPNARWTVETVPHAPGAIRLRSRYGRYLAASSEAFLLGMTGRKVLQAAPSPVGRPDASVEWEPVRDGFHVRFKSRVGNGRGGGSVGGNGSNSKYLRANRGVPPWRNSVTHDVPNLTATQDWVLWDVEIVQVLTPGPATPAGTGPERAESAPASVLAPETPSPPNLRPAPTPQEAHHRPTKSHRPTPPPHPEYAPPLPPEYAPPPPPTTKPEPKLSKLQDLVDSNYAPDTCEDPSFNGVDVDCPVLCRIHKMEPVKCVAFQGTNTGRRFYMCAVENQVKNCGFVAWVDEEEWPVTLQNSLARLWAMYNDSNQARLDERIQNGKLVKSLNDEKSKLQKKYHSLEEDVRKFIADTEKRVMLENLKKMNEEKEQVFDMTRPELEAEMMKLNDQVFKLNEEVSFLKKSQKHDEELRKIRKDKWERKEDVLKEDKKKTDYMLFDLLKVSEANKEKLKQIKQKLKEMEEICGE